MPDGRVMVFVDGSNFYHGLRKGNLPTNIDFGKLSTELCGADRKLIRTYYYNAPLDQTDDPDEYKRQNTFFNRVKRTPFVELRLGWLMKQRRPCDKCSHVHLYKIEKGVGEGHPSHQRGCPARP